MATEVNAYPTALKKLSCYPS